MPAQNGRPRRILCVAEKPSIAKSIAQILSGGQLNTRSGPSPYNKNFEFTYPQTNSFFTVTSVSGHLMEQEFEPMYSKWSDVDPFALFDANVLSSVKKGSQPVANNLRAEIRNAQELMIWTDCDREGEHIGLEIESVCRQVKANITVTRARFSAIIPQQIHHAAQHPVQLDRAQADAVATRMMLDLKTGAAFTRMQTLALQKRVPDLTAVISYGPCQFPTLGFVVARYNQVKAFVPEPFWFIYLTVSRASPGKKNDETVFSWRRGHLFDYDLAYVLYEDVLEFASARVKKVIEKATKKWKPLPLTTVELQKAGSRLLRISPKKVLDIAETLYNQGFLSYPRTETDQYDNQFDFMTLIGKQTADPAWGQFAHELQNGDFQPPRRGKNNDKAHPPIHPTAHAGNLQGDEKRVYEYITRRFLASCSKDALGAEVTVELDYGSEEFYATGLTVLERNYLNVFPYDKWSDKELPQFQEGEELRPELCELREGQTSKPALLTEADLVTMMDKNGIGTDATIATHIQTIVDRDYVVERMQGATKYLVPSKLGIGLVEGYNAIGFDKSLSKPQLRRETERRLVDICEGTKSKREVLDESIEQYKEMFVRTRADFNKILNCVRNRLQGPGDVPVVDAPGGDDGDDNAGGGGGGRGGRGARGGRGSRGGRGGRGAGRGGGSGSRGGPGGHDSDDGSGGSDAGSAPSTKRGRGRARAATNPPRSKAKSRSTAPISLPAPPPPAQPDDMDSDEAMYWQDEIPAELIDNLQPTASSSTARGSSSSSAAAPQCECGWPAMKQKDRGGEPHKRREYWACARKPACDFICWADEWPTKAGGRSKPSSVWTFPQASNGVASTSSIPIKRSYPAKPEGGQVFCRCNRPAIIRETTKGVNQGRKYWSCSTEGEGKCLGFLQWSDDDNNVQGSSRNIAPSAAPRSTTGTSDVCFKCNKPGHWANACPNSDGPAAKRAKTFGSAGSTQERGFACYKCNQEGHFANACPNGQQSSKSSGQPNNGFSRSDSACCYECGQDGHFAKDCPDRRKLKGNGPPCDKCGSDQHSTSRCTSKSKAPSRASSTTRGKRGRGGGTRRNSSGTGTRSSVGRGGGRKKPRIAAADD